MVPEELVFGFLGMMWWFPVLVLLEIVGSNVPLFG